MFTIKALFIKNILTAPVLPIIYTLEENYGICLNSSTIISGL